MQSKRLFVGALVAAGLALSLPAAARADGPTATSGRPMRAAVVDVSKTFKSLKEKTEIETTMKTNGTNLVQEQDRKKKHIEDMAADLKILQEGSPDWVKKQKDLQSALIELKVWMDVETQSVQMDNALQQANLYRKILDAVGRTAKENGYDIVFYKEPDADFTDAKPDAVPAIIGSRKVLWSAPDIDITDQVITKMNNEYVNPASTRPATP